MQGQRRTVAAVIIRSEFEFGHLGRRPRSWLVFARCLQNFLQGQNLFLGDEQPEVATRTGIVTTPGYWCRRKCLLGIEFKTEFGNSCLRPSPHGSLADRADDPRSLQRVVVTLSILDLGPEIFHATQNGRSLGDSQNKHASSGAEA